MKKFIAILSIVALASCGGSQEAATETEATVETVDTAAAAADTAAAAVDTAAAAAPAETN